MADESVRISDSGLTSALLRLAAIIELMNTSIRLERQTFVPSHKF